MLAEKEKKKQKVVEKKPKLVTVKNVGEVYRGDDKLNGVVSLIVYPQQEVDVSEKKARQLIDSFPQNWKVISAEDEKVAEELTELVTEKQFQIHQRTLQKQKETKKTEEKKKDSSFEKSLKEGKVNVVKLTNLTQLMAIVRNADFIGLNNYVHLVKIEKGEIGADRKKNVRYVFEQEKTKKGTKKTGTKPKKKGKKQAEEEETEETGQTVIPIESKDHDVDDIPGDFSDIDDDLDKEDKPKTKKKKTGRKL